MKKTLHYIIIALALFCATTSIISTHTVQPVATAHAQVTIPTQYKPYHAPALKKEGEKYTADSVNYLIQLGSSTLLYAAGAIGVLLLVWGGFQYVTAAGESGQIENAKKTIIWTIVGLLAIIFSLIIVQNIVKWIFKLQEL